MSQKQEPAGEKETGRLESFSDGVFAVAITLLVVDLKVPLVDVKAASPSLLLAQALLGQWPSYLTFMTSSEVAQIISFTSASAQTVTQLCVWFSLVPFGRAARLLECVCQSGDLLRFMDLLDDDRV